MVIATVAGHEGSLATIHANSPRDALARLETMVLMAGTNLTPDVMRHQIASALDVVLQVARLSDGNRKVVSVCEVVGMETDVVTMQEIFAFDRHGINAEGKVIGEFRALLLTTFLSVTVAALAAGFMLGSRRQQALRRALRSRRAPAIN